MATLSNTNLHQYPLSEQDHVHHYQVQPLRRSSGRKKTKSGTEQKKKVTLRGMGVEKLERLIFAERLKKITEINNVNNAPNPYFNNNVVTANVPCSNMSFGQMGFNQSVNGYPGHDQFHGSDLFGSSVVGSSTNSYSPVIANCCNKKKRFNGGGEDCRVLKPVYSVDECRFLGLNIGENHSKSAENQGFEIMKQHQPLMMHQQQVGYAVRPDHPGLEVLAVHKKGSTSRTYYSNDQYQEEHIQGNSQVVMEYEFFPSGTNLLSGETQYNNNGGNDELLMMKMMLGNGNSNEAIDLSLKL